MSTCMKRPTTKPERSQKNQKKKKISSLHLKYKKYLIWPIKYSKHYKSTEYMKSIILSINMIGNEKQKTWQKNTIFKSKMLKVLRRCYFNTCYFHILKKTS